MSISIAEPTKVVSPTETSHLEIHVRQRVSGRIRELRVIRQGSGLILRGRTRSYYVKQLAQHAVMEAVQVPILANEIEVF